jgi:hypothetical protein
MELRLFAEKKFNVSDLKSEKIKLKGTHQKSAVLFIEFPASRKIVSLKCAQFYNDRGDNRTRLSPGDFSWNDARQGVFVCMHDKINRPFFVAQTIERSTIEIKSIDKLKRRTAPASATPYSNGFKKTKSKISWGTSSPRCGDIERQLTIPSKLGLIHSEGSTFLLNNRVIATVENGNILPHVDVTTKNGDYLYRRVMSIFDMDHCVNGGHEYHIKDGVITKDGTQIGYWDSHSVRFNSKANDNDKKVIDRMIACDETLTWVSSKKREIQQALA